MQELERIAGEIASRAVVRDGYMGVSFAGCADALDGKVKQFGMKCVTLALSKAVCACYAQTMGTPYPLDDATVAYEIEFHLDGYLYSLGRKSYFWKRNVLTWAFPKSLLKARCETADIYVYDMYKKPSRRGFWEAVLFRYHRGLRK